jgi:hypothetical protein
MVNKYHNPGGGMIKKYILINVEHEGAIVIDSSAYADFNGFLDECFGHLDSNNIAYTYTYMDDAELLAYRERQCDAE